MLLLSGKDFEIMKIVFVNMDRNCLLGEEMCFLRSDIDVVLLVFEDVMKRKFNSLFIVE